MIYKKKKKASIADRILNGGELIPRQDNPYKSILPGGREPYMDLDFLWRKTVRHLAGGSCELCKAPTRRLCPLEVPSHHLVLRRHLRYRYDPLNGMSLCVRCHHIAHEAPLRFHDELNTARNDARYDLMINWDRTPMDFTSISRDEWEEEWRIVLRGLLNGR